MDTLQKNPLLLWIVLILVLVASLIGNYFGTKRQSKRDAKRFADRMLRIQQRSLSDVVKRQQLADYNLWEKMWPPALVFGIPTFVLGWMFPEDTAYIEVGFVLLMFGFLLDAITALVRRFILDTVDKAVANAVDEAVEKRAIRERRSNADF